MKSHPYASQCREKRTPDYEYHSPALHRPTSMALALTAVHIHRALCIVSVRSLQDVELYIKGTLPTIIPNIAHLLTIRGFAMRGGGATQL